MNPSSSETTSPTPISPFSSTSPRSEATSDEIPDLGAFTTVFRELSTLHVTPTLRRPEPRSGRRIYDESEDFDLSVWSVRPNTSPYVADDARDLSGDTSANSEESDDGDLDVDDIQFPLSSSVLSYRTRSLSAHSTSPAGPNVAFSGLPSDPPRVNVDDLPQPTLGLLDTALSFLAAERAKKQQRLADASRTVVSTEGGPPKTMLLDRRRKRRRKRNNRTSKTPTQATTESCTNETAVDDHDADDSASSSYDHSSSNNYESPTFYKSSPATPHRRGFSEKDGQQKFKVLHSSKSTPHLSLYPPSMGQNLLKLMILTDKLKYVFPSNSASLDRLKASLQEDPDDFIDVRGPSFDNSNPLIHVFVDHSNILFGLLNWLRRHRPRVKSQTSSTPTLLSKARLPISSDSLAVSGVDSGGPAPQPKASRHLSHTALCLILERGRPVQRRVVVTSSPLYQPMESAERLGYEVHIYQRVPIDSDDTFDRLKGHSRSQSANTSNNNRLKTHSRRISGSENELGGGSSPSSPSSVTAAMSRIRFREQGVDELLQLKLHQAIADADDGQPLPKNATIVLATGDGNVGQFNNDGFLGTVRTALRKGWNVELYAWEDGLSRAWQREFGAEERFTIIGLEQFGDDLVESGWYVTSG
ncbi:hypothetical protein FISHEDRAFT_71857 [Fistulina hepatica ATCC 64428]|uniref:NYN domain-containing protein n=1 Tax=Fistulina hepatica ATCC 64428 TaxID=1128425 RepID=A0A0D7AHE2_9AGAR|nr:hypothetical protein FISHEDRAFT_71857 [Fistulina hepatica ATCC 64428]